MDRIEPVFKIAVVDDEIGKPGIDRDNFLSRVKRNDSEFLFLAGQTEDGRNVPQVTIDALAPLWTQSGASRLSIVFLDVSFRDPRDLHSRRFGFTLLAELRKAFGPTLPIVMLTNEQDVRQTANRAAADGFLPKDGLDPDSFSRQMSRNAVFPEKDSGLLGTSNAYLLLLRDLRRLMQGGIMEVLLLGETGTGKSDLARFAHNLSGRPSHLFRTWFARNTSPDLHYDSLFGHWGNAFTGAGRATAGIAEQAHGGTLFIDEIADLNPAVQADLLEYRQRQRDNLRRIRRLGTTPSMSPANLNVYGRYSPEEDRILVDTLLLTATNKALDDPETRKRLDFRQDLFNRLGQPVKAPPLRERIEDIAPLFEAFIRQSTGREIRLGPGTQALLESHEWRDGNVAELKQLAEVMGARIGREFDEIFPHHLDGMVRHSTPQSLPSPSPQPNAKLQEERSGAATSGYSGRTLADLEVNGLEQLTECLRNAVIQTRRPGSPGTLSDIFKFATGAEYSVTDVQREIKEMLSPLFAPNERQTARWANHKEYRTLAERVRSDALLAALYRYAIGQMSWSDAKKQISAAIEDDPGRQNLR